MAGAVAGALRAAASIMLTDVAGVLDPEGKLIQSIRVEDAAGLYENGTVTGGMIPKLNCCIDAIEQGVEKVMIVDGRVENCVLLELLTDQGVVPKSSVKSAEKKRRCGKAVLVDLFYRLVSRRGR